MAKKKEINIQVHAFMCMIFKIMVRLSVYILAAAVVSMIFIYSETCLYDHLRNRDNLGIKDSYSSP